MSTDFIKHQALITKFRGLVNKAGFDAKFASATSKLAKTETFLLKMELKRLASPCTRAIDLRGLVDGDCQVFKYQEQSHFLDEIAINTFNENVDIYGGYTFGVYEAVQNTKNNFRNIYKSEQGNPGADNLAPANATPIQAKSQYSAKLYQFNNYPNRCEERMNFAIAIGATLSDNHKIQATSVDISVSGVKIRLTQEVRLKVGETIQVFFTGLEQEFQFGKNSRFTYTVQNVYHDATTQLVGCQRIDVAEKDGFENFLKGFIQGNKRRYKINLDNTIQSLQARSFEQFSLVKLNELVVYVQAEQNSYTPRYALTTLNNSEAYHYWQNEKGVSTLHYLMNEQRLAHLLKPSSNSPELLVYSFIHHHQGNSFFYTMDEQQAQEDMLFFRQFIAFAASKDSFAVTQMSALPVVPSRIHSPFTLAGATTKQQYINSPPSDEVKKQVSQLTHIVVAKDITHEENYADYQKLSFEGIDRKKLKLFGHQRSTQPSTIDEIGINYKNQRQEPRFKYKTSTTIECEGVTWTGVSEDFSISGLKVELAEPALLNAGDIVYLSFPKLQQITSSFDLKELPYKVVRINKAKTTINLRVSVKEHQHIGRSFFRLLIEKNRSKLTPDEYAMLTPGLAEGLRTLYATSLNTPSFAVQTSGSRYKTEAMLLSEPGSQYAEGSLLKQMEKLSDRKGFYNLYPILSNLQVTSLLDNHLKKLVPSDKSICEVLYIAINPNVEQVEKAVKVQLASDLNTPELKQFFIKKSLKQGLFFSVQLRLSRADDPQMEFLSPELNYVSAYAIHRGKQIEQDILSTAGIMQMFNTTAETLLRYRFMQE